MDCERLDSLAIDLIDPPRPGEASELDPRVTREAEEHLAACTRCSAAIERLRGGLRAGAELGLEDPSSLLEARILAAAGAIKPEVSFSRRVARAITTAGAWAMRPQVAMAAVLVVMVGTSIVLLRGGGLPGAHRTKVTEEGTPVATLEPASPAVEGQGAPAVIGGEDKKEKAKEAPKQEAAPTPREPIADLPKAANANANKADDSIVAEKEESKLAKKPAAKDLESAAADEDGNAYGTTAGGGAKGKAMMPPPPPAAAPAPAPAPIGGLGGAPGDLADKSEGAATKKSAGPAATTAPATSTPASTFDDAMSAYKEARYAVAAKGFDAAAAAGQKVPSALLYAGRSYRATGSCPLALPRFQKVVSSYPASPEAPHAAIEGGRCAKTMGDTATARALFEKAKTYPATQKQAESELAALDKPAQASPPAKAKATSKPSAVDNGY